MSRTALSLSALCLALAPMSSGAATVYRCHTAQGWSYQDQPCHGSDVADNQFDVSEPSVVKNTRTDALRRWSDEVGQQNQQRELQTRAQNLEQQNRADAAEFAAMVEESDKQREASAQGGADLPPTWEIDQQQRQAQREYQSRVQERNAKLRAVQAEINQSQ